MQPCTHTSTTTNGTHSPIRHADQINLWLLPLFTRSVSYTDSTHKLSKPNISQISADNTGPGQCAQPPPAQPPEPPLAKHGAAQVSSQSINAMHDAERDASAKPITNPLSKSISLNNCYQYAKASRSGAHTPSQYTAPTNAKQTLDPLQDRPNASQLATNATQKL